MLIIYFYANIALFLVVVLKELEVVKSNQEALIADLENSLREIGSLEEEHEILKHKLALAENCIEELKAALKNKEVDALQESSTEEQLMCKVEELRKHSENLFAENEQLKIDLASKIAELSNIRRHAEVETLSEHLTEKQEKQISKEGVSEVSDSESLISELRVQLQIALDQLKELSSQKEAMERFLEQKQAEKSDTGCSNEDVSELKSRLEKSNRQFEASEEILAQKNSLIANLQSTIQEMEARMKKCSENSFGEECCARQDIHNDDTNSKDETAEDLVKMAELKANLQLTIVERQKLFEELAHLREVHETAAFELAELQQEHDSLKTEADQLRGQLGEWEHLMDMVS